MDKSFFRNWIITTLGVVAAAHIVDGISYETPVGLVITALVLGVLTALLKPILVILALPLIIVTMGLFVLVINGVLLYFAGSLMKTFQVDGFGPAFWGALIISIVNVIASIVWPPKGTRVEVRTSSSHSRGKRDGDGGGPVIDV